MDFNQMKVVNNIGLLSLNELLSLDCKVEKECNLHALVIIVNEEQITQTDAEKLYEIINSLPCITIAAFHKYIGKKALWIGSATHIRIALCDTKCDIIYEDILSNQKILSLLGSEVKKKSWNLKENIEHPNALHELGLISNVFRDLECEEFFQWGKLLFGNKSKEQVFAIKCCYDKYRFMMPKTNDRGVLALEESKQFCMLAVNLYKKSRLES